MKRVSNGSSLVVSQQQLEELLSAFAQGDADAAIAGFAKNASFADPLFPQRQLQGRENILKAFKQVLALISESSFKIETFLANHDTAMAEVSTFHRYRGGFEANYQQVFVVQVNELGEFSSVSSYSGANVGTLGTALVSPFKRLLSKPVH